mgnify:FL=1
MVLVLGILVSVPRSAHAEENPDACNCVIFRLDDIQDSWLNTVQVELMDRFIEEDKKLNVGVIMNFLGEDESVVDKVQEGLDSGNFEIVNHGWNHVAYNALTAQEQHDTLVQADEKIVSLWGADAVAFIPPYHEYNEDTLAALEDLDMKIISAEFSLELPSIYHHGDPGNPDNKIYKAMPDSDIKDQYGIYHLPQAAEFFAHDGGTPTKVPLETLIEEIEDSISTYGYAVVTLHPSDFAIKDENDEPTNEVSTSELEDLDALLAEIDNSGYATKTFSEAIQFGSSGGNGGNGNGNGDNGDGNGNGSNNNGSTDNDISQRVARLVESMMDKAKKIAAEGIPSDDQIPDELIKYRMFDLARWGGPEFSAALYLTDLVPSLNWNKLTEKQQIYYIEKMMGYI